MLTIALRQRHRAVAVVHVLARLDEASKRAAAIVGASGVLSWPLPLIEDVLAVIPLSLPTSPPSTSSLAPFADETGQVPLLSADASAINSTAEPLNSVDDSNAWRDARYSNSDKAITNLVHRAKSSSSDVFAASPSSSASPSKRSSFSPATRARIAVDIDIDDDGDGDGDDDDDDDDDGELATAPRLRASAQSLAEPVAATKTVATLLAAIPDLLPLLVDSASFLEALQVHRVRGAEGHARAIHQAVRLLTQMYTQLDAGIDD